MPGSEPSKQAAQQHEIDRAQRHVPNAGHRSERHGMGDIGAHHFGCRQARIQEQQRHRTQHAGADGGNGHQRTDDDAGGDGRGRQMAVVQFVHRAVLALCELPDPVFQQQRRGGQQQGDAQHAGHQPVQGLLIQREIFQQGDGEQCGGQAAQAQQAHDFPVHRAVAAVHPAAQRLGQRGIQQIGADRRRGRDAEEQHQQRGHQRPAADAGHPDDQPDQKAGNCDIANPFDRTPDIHAHDGAHSRLAVFIFLNTFMLVSYNLLTYTEQPMNLQQLRYLNEIVRCGLNISDAANALYTSQPGVSKQIKLLEEELGIDIFVRNGKRIVAITEPGKAVLDIAQRVLHETENLKQVGQEFRTQDSGSLTIATTHTQARYALPHVVKEFTQELPGREARPAPGQPDADRRAGIERRGGHRHRHREPGALRRTRHPALLRMAPLRGRAAQASAAAGKTPDAEEAGAISHHHL